MFLSTLNQDSDFSSRIVVTRYTDGNNPSVQSPNIWEFPGHIAALNIVSRMILNELRSMNHTDGKSVAEFNEMPYRANFKTKLGSDDVAFLEYHVAETGEIKTLAKYSIYTLRIYFKTENIRQRWEYRLAKITELDTPGLPGRFEVMINNAVLYTAPSLSDALSYVDAYYCKNEQVVPV